jgi:hypothetical protein
MQLVHGIVKQIRTRLDGPYVSRRAKKIIPDRGACKKLPWILYVEFCKIGEPRSSPPARGVPHVVVTSLATAICIETKKQLDNVPPDSNK